MKPILPDGTKWDQRVIVFKKHSSGFFLTADTIKAIQKLYASGLLSQEEVGFILDRLGIKNYAFQ